MLNITFHFIVCKRFFGKQEDKKPKEKRSTLSQDDKKGRVPSTNRNSEKTAIPLARWRMERGSLGWVVAWRRGGGEQEGQVRSIGHGSVNRTAKDLMHHSEENQGPSTHALPIFHVVGWCPTAGRVVCPVRRGAPGGWSAAHPPSLLSWYAGRVCAGCRGGGRSAHDLQVWVEVSGQQGQGLGEVEKLPPFTRGARCRGQSPGPCGRASLPQPRT